MSVIGVDEQKIESTRGGPDLSELIDLCVKGGFGSLSHKPRWLVALFLVCNGWTFSQVAACMGVHRAHCGREVGRLVDELRDHCGVEL